MLIRMVFILSCVLVLLLGTAGVFAEGQQEGGGMAESEEDYPSKPISLIVPWGAGGGADTAARTVAAVAQDHLGVPLVPVLQPGSSGTIAHADFMDAKPDGYKLIITTNSPIVTVPQLRDVPYDPLTDFKFIIRITNLRNVIAVRATADYTNLDELVAYAKENPGELRVGHSGAQGIGHMTVLLMESELGIDVADVPFTTSGEAVVAAAGNHIDGCSASIASAAPQIEAGNLIPIALSAFDRDPFYPDIPTFRELGYEVAIDNQISIGGPKDLPEEKVQFIHDAIKATLEDESFQNLANRMAMTVDYLGPEDLMASVETSVNSVKRAVAAME